MRSHSIGCAGTLVLACALVLSCGERKPEGQLVSSADDGSGRATPSAATIAANTSVLPTGYPTDLLGLPRAFDVPTVDDTGVAVVGLTTDMGAYEFHSVPPLRRFER